MDKGELGRELLENLHGGGLIVDEDAALAGREHLAAKNDLGAFGIDAVGFENGLGAGSGLKDARDDGFFGAVSDYFRRRFAAHQQREGVDKNGFARAGFSGEEVEPGAERGNSVIDDGVVFSAQFDEHFLFRVPCSVQAPEHWESERSIA